MRSVDKGSHPTLDTGELVQLEPYQEATPHLKIRLGRYCSFCERSVSVSLAVEHKLPKVHFPDLAYVWDNFLLGCANCNGVKGARFVANEAVMFPDTHDTFGALEYLESGRVRPRADLPAPHAEQAHALLNLVGLSREPRDLSEADHRWDDRLETWSLAIQSREDLAKDDTPAMRAAILRTAASRGGFSIWMAAFAEDSVMRRALSATFPGTRVLDEAA
ncbi:hypothetical protein PV762_13095 [Mitsuaria sp. CC2]|uniref:HNH endonuclease n=1 Tax=Mitsuaria sp. CC2 TaxID=3029186 RepID=UPI003B8E0B28